MGEQNQRYDENGEPELMRFSNDRRKGGQAERVRRTSSARPLPPRRTAPRYKSRAVEAEYDEDTYGDYNDAADSRAYRNRRVQRAQEAADTDYDNDYEEADNVAYRSQRYQNQNQTDGADEAYDTDDCDDESDGAAQAGRNGSGNGVYGRRAYDAAGQQARRTAPAGNRAYKGNGRDTSASYSSGRTAAGGGNGGNSRYSTAGNAGAYTAAAGRNSAPSGARPAARRKKKTARTVLTVLLAFVLCFAAYSFVKPFIGGRYWTVAVFGVDSRDGNLEKGALSDVEMLASIDRRTGDIKLVSVYRDTYLKIDDDGNYHKINEAYFKGGHKQAVKALEENLDLHIDDYITFNWAAVAKAINALGGVDIDISDAEFSYINAFITETVNSTGIGSVQLKKAGQNHLDGVQAVAYGRLRLMDTDFNRTARQRKVIGLAMDKAKSADPGTLVNLARAILPEVSTSIDITDAVGIARNIKKYNIAESTGFPFSRQAMKIGKMDCVVATTLESNVSMLHEKLYGTENYKPSAKVAAISQHIGRVTGLTEAGDVAPEAGTGGGTAHKDKTQNGGSGSGKQETAAETKPEPETSTEAEKTTEAETTEKETVEPKETETTARETQKGPGETAKGPGETSRNKSEKETTAEAGPSGGKTETTAAHKETQEIKGDTPVVQETKPTAPGGPVSDGSDSGPGV